MTYGADLVEHWAPGRPVPLVDILGVLRRGTGDPTMVTARGDVWWGVTTPAGPVATWWHLISARERADAVAGDTVTLRAYGPGAEWFHGRLGQVLGDGDEQAGFTAHHEPVRRALTVDAHRHWRVVRTGLVVASLIPSILEQKVTGKQAFGGFRRLVRAHGTALPLPPSVLAYARAHGADVSRLMAAPSARQWKRIPSWDWLQAGVEPPQSRTVMRALSVADALEATAQLPTSEAHRRMRAVPGLGVWTTAKVAQTAWGDADAPTFADYHVAKQVGQALIGRDVDDAGMARLLEPYRGHRYRAEHFILAMGARRERHGARMALPAHLPVRG